MAKKVKEIDWNYQFTLEEINLIISQAEKIGFTPIPNDTRKKFDVSKITSTIIFTYKNSELMEVNKYDFKAFGVTMDNFTEFVIRKLFDDISYVREELYQSQAGEDW